MKYMMMMSSNSLALKFQNHLRLFSSLTPNMNVNSPGSVTIAGVAVLQSPQPIDPQKGPQNIVFDVNICIVEGSQTITMALLRYFAPS